MIIMMYFLPQLSALTNNTVMVNRINMVHQNFFGIQNVAAASAVKGPAMMAQPGIIKGEEALSRGGIGVKSGPMLGKTLAGGILTKAPPVFHQETVPPPP